jgi:hypothetical protein
MLPVAQLPESPSGFGLQNGSEGFLPRFLGRPAAGIRLACEDLRCHLGDALVLSHELPFLKIFGLSKPLLSRVGDRQPARQTLVVPLRQRVRLVVDLLLHRYVTSR